jgi:hypothetical protein
MYVPHASRYDQFGYGFSGCNELWLSWYAKGQYAARRTLITDSRYWPLSTWESDQRAWRLGFAEAAQGDGWSN